jgi:Fe-S protein assembly chaperone HscA
MKPSMIVGIDLGTTHSLVAVVRDGIPKVLESREGHRLVPSVVSFEGGKPVVGYSAKNKKLRNVAGTIFSVKRLLGKGFGDLTDARDQLPFEIIDDQGIPKMKISGRMYSAIEISALILTELKMSAEQALGENISKAVITVPAYFNDSQRQATRAAGRLAGLDVVRIVNEPTAAALAYGLDRLKDGIIAVYDLGGGTFDVSILRLHDGIFEVLATQGDTQLGGDDLDWAIVEYIVGSLKQNDPEYDPLSDIENRARLIEVSERAKISLSEQEQTLIEVSLTDGVSFRATLTRTEFERLIQPLLERTREPCLAALRDCEITPDQLSDVILVGGPTRLSVVKKMAQAIFGRVPNSSVHPDEVVAAGAAIQADILAGNNRDLLLLDVVPLSLGIETYGGLMAPLIARNTKIPAVAREVFTTYADRQTGVDIHVLQGERERVEDNRSLAKFKLAGIQPQPAGLPRIEVSFLVDADGILNVSAKDIKTGLEQAIEVRPTFGLTPEQVEKMIRDKIVFQQDDLEFKRVVQAKAEAEPVLRSTEKSLTSAKKILPLDEFQQIEAQVAVLKTALQGKDPDGIRQATFSLSRSTENLALKLVQEIREVQDES